MYYFRRIVQFLNKFHGGKRTCWARTSSSLTAGFFTFKRKIPFLPITSYLVYSLSSVFIWNQDGIDDREFNKTIRQFWKMSNEKPVNGLEGSNGSNGNGDDDEWEPIILKDHFQVYRRLHSKGSNLYQYKIYGTFKDIPAKAFFLVQLDTSFRKVWDRLVVKLDIVDSEGEEVVSTSGQGDNDYEKLLDDCIKRKSNFDSKNQVVHWIMHYPYPMYCREYCYVRRAKIDLKNNLMIIISRATNHPKCSDNGDHLEPIITSHANDDDRDNSSKSWFRGFNSPEKLKYVRVDTYDSRMVIRPHSTFDEDGFDYLLTYFDDPQSNFPSAAYNWMAYSGVPDFVNKLYSAAIRINERRKGLDVTTDDQGEATTTTTTSLNEEEVDDRLGKQEVSGDEEQTLSEELRHLLEERSRLRRQKEMTHRQLNVARATLTRRNQKGVILTEIERIRKREKDLDELLQFSQDQSSPRT